MNQRGIHLINRMANSPQVGGVKRQRALSDSDSERTAGRNLKRQSPSSSLVTLPIPRVFSWDVKRRLVPKSVETILGDFQRQLDKFGEVLQRVEHLERRVNALALAFDQFEEMDIMWAQEVDAELEGIREELGLARRAYGFEPAQDLGYGSEIVPDSEASEHEAQSQ